MRRRDRRGRVTKRRSVTRKILQRLIGKWNFVLQHRRPLMAVLQETVETYRLPTPDGRPVRGCAMFERVHLTGEVWRELFESHVWAAS